MNAIRAICGFVLVGLLLAGLPAAATVTVFAAISAKNALDDAADAYGKETGDKVIVSYAASSALARQIENGAPADLFISADQQWMDYLAERRLIKPETRVDLLRNTLVLIAPAASKVRAEIKAGFPLASLLGDGRLAMANPDSVPAGKYGKAALEYLGVWSNVQSRVAPAENVRAALALVSRGEAPLGIVYATDVLADPGVRVVGEFPAASHPPIVYPAAVTADSKGSAAEKFLRYLVSPAAKQRFAKYGFH